MIKLRNRVTGSEIRANDQEQADYWAGLGYVTADDDPPVTRSKPKTASKTTAKKSAAKSK